MKIKMSNQGKLEHAIEKKNTEWGKSRFYLKLKQIKQLAVKEIKIN
jgi:hypothetical protein